jgi:hypothetical protein
LYPPIPCAPAPGGVAAEQMYRPGAPVLYGSSANLGLNRICSGVFAPVMMSPPT